MYVVVAIIAFGILIAVHELGHFTAAKLLGVRVNEFAIGMGPKIMKKQGKETLYSFRALPLGGFCAFDDGNDAGEDPRSFMAQKRWRRVVILLAGSVANIIAAFIVVVLLTSGATRFAGTTITNLVDAFPNKGEDGLMIGDTIVSINGERLYYIADFELFMQLADSGQVDLVIKRDGAKIKLDKFPLERREYVIDGETVLRYGITFNLLEATSWEKLKHSSYTTMNYARLIRVSIAQIISGPASVGDVSGMIGIVDAMNDIGQTAPTVRIALGSIAFFMAFIGVNLAIMNLLPIPALDGGRILFVFITWLIELIFRRRLDPKYEGYIHNTAMVLLMGLMVVILVNDVVKLVNG